MTTTAKILRFLSNPLTIYELSKKMKLSYRTCDRKVYELRREGKVQDVGKKEVKGRYRMVFQAIKE